MKKSKWILIIAAAAAIIAAVTALVLVFDRSCRPDPGLPDSAEASVEAQASVEADASVEAQTGEAGT